MTYLYSIASIFIFMNLYFLWSQKVKNLGVVDIAWGKGFVIIALIHYMLSVHTIFHLTITAMVSLWGLRLAIYLFKRNHNKPEDFRYSQLRQEWGNSTLQAYMKVFIFQGFLMFIVSMPVTQFLNNNFSFSGINYLGVLIFAYGFTWEVWADKTLADFKKSGKGKLCTEGPWKYSRHPNYFGEITLWYGIYFACFNNATWWTLIGPVTIHFFIIKVSGIAFLKDRMKKYPEYSEYFENTNALIPNFFIK